MALRTLLARSEECHASPIDVLGMTKGAASKVISWLEQKAWRSANGQRAAHESSSWY